MNVRAHLFVFVLQAATFAAPPAWLDDEAKALHPEVVKLRRDFHQNPELSNAEERTSRIVAERLRSLGLDVRTGVAKHGVVALLKGAKPGPCVALRADMDALPIEEAGNAPFKSQNPGIMHACGHDAHTAIALGVAELLSRHRGEIAGSIKFIFQPAEEALPATYKGDWGAKLMLAEGALENPVPSAIFALHCSSTTTAINANGERNDVPLRAGQIGWGSGAISANSDRFAITVRGKMAHGAAPGRGVDAIQVAASIITELQTIRSRHSDAQEPLVVTVGMIKGGLRENIIADKVEMSGTVRTASTAMQKRASALLKQIAEKTAEAHGAKAEVTYREGYPAVINDAALVRRMLPVLRGLVGESSVVEAQPGMGGEDFAYFAQKVPGFYLRLGVARPGVERPAGGHTPEFEIDEAALLTGVRMMTSLALEAVAIPAAK